MADSKATKEPEKTQEELRRERVVRAEEAKKRRAEAASEFGAMVFNPSNAEAATVLSMSWAVERMFYTNRRAGQRANIVDTNNMEAQLLFREAIVEFADSLKQISKIVKRDYKEDALIKEYRKEIPKQRELLEKIKAL